MPDELLVGDVARGHRVTVALTSTDRGPPSPLSGHFCVEWPVGTGHSARKWPLNGWRGRSAGTGGGDGRRGRAGSRAGKSVLPPGLVGGDGGGVGEVQR